MIVVLPCDLVLIDIEKSYIVDKSLRKYQQTASKKIGKALL